MEHIQESGPGQDSEELGSSPSSSSKGRRGGAGQPGGFADGRPADVLAAGPGLAALVAAAAGGDGAALGSLGDQEVLGVVAAGGRMAAWAAWVQLAGLAEFARRRPGVMSSSRTAREAAEEASWKTAETWPRMMDQLARAVTIARRLPRTLEAMRDGHVSDYKARIIEAQTAELSDTDVAKADVLLAAAGQVKNPAGLRDFARRQVARLDPDAATRRKERARQDAYVRIYQEDSGNAGLSARQMPAAEAVIAWANIERRALDLHAAGAEGTAGQLQVQATLDFLLGRAVPGQGAHSGAHEDSHPDAGGSACQDTQPAARGGGRGGWAVNPVLLVPWDASLGAASGPAELPGFGLLDEDDTMDLLRAAADNPASRWCITVHGQDGAAAHGCATGRRTPDAITGTGTAAGLAARLGVTLTPLTNGACEHTHAESGYTPSRALRHLIQARNTRCTAPGCGRPAAACDVDHTIPWEDGGVTCECNLSPLCRGHHQIKQAQGWKLEQPEPGVLTWVSPSGLTRTTAPTSYRT
ncbi:MAG TPA: DUF222 domain-containing protein [Streptosporangiaceae bacterium]|nr:DUF222 domain-containing protein [Streptosporangiaceae bacterium]